MPDLRSSERFSPVDDPARVTNRWLAGITSRDAAALIADVAHGSYEALEELYRLYGRPAYGVALHVLGDETLAEDAVTDAFLAVSSIAGTFRPEVSSPAAWIFMLVHRRAVVIVRRERRRQGASLGELPRAEEPSTEEAAVARSERRRVSDALAQLPREQRDALELSYYGGLTQAQLADRLRVPLGTVRRRTFAALARLRTLLGEPERVSLRWGVRTTMQAAIGDPQARRTADDAEAWRGCGGETATRLRPSSTRTAPG